jgi:hypothetical protein
MQITENVHKMTMVSYLVARVTEFVKVSRKLLERASRKTVLAALCLPRKSL